MKLEEVKNEFINDDGIKIKIIPIGNGSEKLARELHKRLGARKAYGLTDNTWGADYFGNEHTNTYGLPEKDLALFNAYNHLEEGMEMVGYGEGQSEEEGFNYFRFNTSYSRFHILISPKFHDNNIYARRKKEEEKLELIIEEGKRYMMRNGEFTEPVKKNDNTHDFMMGFIFQTIIQNAYPSSIRTYRSNGSCDDLRESEFDLIAEYTPPANTININGYEVPEPVREPLAMGELHYIADITYAGKPQRHSWEDDVFDHHALKNGLIHLTKKAVKKHNKALKSFTKLNK